MASACTACGDELTVTIEPQSDEDQDLPNGTGALATQTLPDDVHLLACGHHYHWSEALITAHI